MNDCYLHAVKLLTKKDYSKLKLRVKLAAKGFDEIQITETIEQLTQRQFLNQDCYALDLIVSLLRKGYGAALIAERLQQEELKLSDELLANGYERLKVDPKDHLKAVIIKKGDLPISKIYNYCVAKGHDPDLVESLLNL